MGWILQLAAMAAAAWVLHMDKGHSNESCPPCCLGDRKWCKGYGNLLLHTKRHGVGCVDIEIPHTTAATYISQKARKQKE